QCRSTSLQCFHHICRLRGAAAGIFRGEKMGVLLMRQILNKWTNTYICNLPAVFCANFHCVRISDHIFTPITFCMTIYTALHCFKYSTFSVIPSTNNECNALFDCHSFDRVFTMWKLNRYFIFRRTLERDCLRERPLTYTTSPR